ncbi:hypothetical protein PRIPAC_77213 [Pristionchus pacificus]|uniref:Uncharacterized protein n=1 Tax=Pristionchus pacificus TaxID=54126 RepID=A0A2A6C347_PRIPA|nr:hypothetical protein PRIPAC_77213 [Pristionchus pacificus]|eukprot:PDM72527.1 hypothetical protein PRIPAC_38961 [Pristionchus pacificus]
MAVVDFLADFILLPLFIYLWISLIFSKDNNLRINFYTLFCVTGVFEVISAVVHILIKLLSFSTEQAWVYTVLIAILHIGEMSATMGKLFNIIDRYEVMSGDALCEIKYYPICEIILQIVLPILTALHLCDYLSAAAALRIMNGTSRWFLYQGILNIIVYSTFIMMGIGLSVKPLARFNRAIRCTNSNDLRRKKAIRYYKRMVEATGSICISHSFKASYQILVGVIAILEVFDISVSIPYMDTLNFVTNGLSIYFTPFVLVIFSRRVRRSLQWEIFKKAINRIVLVKNKTFAKLLMAFSREHH